MNLAEVNAFVALRLSPATEPVVTDDEVVQLIAEHAATVDADGVLPTEDGWVATYSRMGAYAALAEGWNLKAGRVSHRFDFTAPSNGGTFRVSQIMDHCEAQSKKFALLGNYSVNTSNAV